MEATTRHVQDAAHGGGSMEAQPQRAAAVGPEQVALLVLGGALLTRGLQQRSLGGAAVALAGGALLYRTIGDNPQLAQSLGLQTVARTLPQAQAPEVQRSITIQRPADEIYRLWREPQTLSRIMEDAADITSTDADHAHWAVSIPGGQRLEWDTRVVEDRPGKLVRWETAGETPIAMQSEVRFRPAPGDRGTEVALRLRFEPPGGTLGAAALKHLSILPATVASKALRKLKSLIETGEIPTLKGQPAARDGGRDK